MKHYLIFTSILLFTFFVIVTIWMFGSAPKTTTLIPVTPTTTVPVVVVTNFTECAAVVGIVMESYPRQCRYNGQTYVEEIGNVLEKQDLIQLTTPQPNTVISTPLVVSGQARGTWFFEGSFPVTLTNWDGLIIAEGIARAQGEWMTEEFVPFTTMLTFEYPALYTRGALILKKDNPSGLPENDDALEIPVWFSATSSVEVMY
jgi:hypothetical protein